MANKKLHIACYISIGLLGIYISIYQSVINSISTQFALSKASVGIIIALHFIGSITAPLIFGEISDRIGKKPVVVMSFGILIAGLMAVYLFSSLFLTAAGIFLIGCGFAVIEGTLSGVLSDTNTGQSSRAISMSQMFFSIGAVVGPMASLLLLRITGNWKAVFVPMILLFAVTLLYFIRLKSGEGLTVTGNRRKAGGKMELISIKLLKEKAFLLLIVSIFIYVGIEESVAFWINTYFIDLFNESKLGTYALSGYWASMILGRYLAGRFYTKRNLFLKGGLLLSLFFIITALLFKSSMLSLICFVGAGLGFSAVWPAIMSRTADSYPEYTGTAMGIMMTAGAGGGMAIPFLTGAVASLTTIGIAFWILPVFIVLILIIQKGEKNKAADPFCRPRSTC